MCGNQALFSMVCQSVSAPDGPFAVGAPTDWQLIPVKPLRGLGEAMGEDTFIERCEAKLYWETKRLVHL